MKTVRESNCRDSKPNPPSEGRFLSRAERALARRTDTPKQVGYLRSPASAPYSFALKSDTVKSAYPHVGDGADVVYEKCFRDRPKNSSRVCPLSLRESSATFVERKATLIDRPILARTIHGPGLRTHSAHIKRKAQARAIARPRWRLVWGRE